MLSIHNDEFLESIRKGNLPRINELLATDPTLASTRTKEGVSSILLALYHGHPDIARTIGSKKSDLDIFESSVLGNIERVKGLITGDHKLVELHSPDGFTSLALAAYVGQKEVTEYLINKGADVNAVARNPTGFTALTGAIASNHTEIAEMLVKKGANVNHRYEEGFSPLMEAAENGNLELVNFLIANGANVKARTKDGKSPLNLARKRNHAEVVSVLEKHGA